MSKAHKHKRAFFRRMVMVAAVRSINAAKPCGHGGYHVGCRECERASIVTNGLWQKCLAAEPRGYDESAHFHAMHRYGRAAVAAGVTHAG